MKAARPFVLANLAITADGCLATVNRRVSSFGSPADREHLFELRASVDAVMCGARTVREGWVRLDAGPRRFRQRRLARGLSEQPLRIVVSGSGRLPAHLPLFTSSTAPLLVLTTSRALPGSLRDLKAMGVECLQFGDHAVDLVAALHWLRRHWKVRRLLTEGGGRLNASLLQAGLVDELHLTVCPMIFGGRHPPSIADGALSVALSEARRAKLLSFKKRGEEAFLKYAL